MHPDRIQALIAQCLTEPDDLSAIATDNEWLEEADLRRIALFRGFIVKVKHNQVRKVLPLTLRLLPALGLELTFFSEYAPTYLTMRATGLVPLDRQVEQLATSLKRFLDQRSGLRVEALRDVLTHESTLWSFQSAVVDEGRPPRRGQLSWLGRLTLEQYKTNVLAACGALASRQFDPARHIRTLDCTLAYWRPRDSDVVEFFEVDALTALLVSAAQRHHTIGGIGRALAATGLTQISRRDLDEFFRQLAERGFLRCA